MGRMTDCLVRFGAALALSATVVGAAAAQAQQRQPGNDEATIALLKSMQKELQEIKALLAARPAPATPSPTPAGPQQAVSLDLSNRPFRGDKAATLAIVEVTDYQCPFCSRHARQTLPQIEKEYIATGNARYYVIDLPLESIHRHAFKAAVATRCAGDEGKYWEMHDRLFANQHIIEQWDAHAAAIGLDVAKFGACLASDKYAAVVRGDIALAQRVGITGTPGFYLGFVEGPGGRVKTSRYVAGAVPFERMKGEVDALLAQREAVPGRKETGR